MNQYNTPIIKQIGFVIPGDSSSLYNQGNDDTETMNRFAFPAISFSPSFPLSMSIGGPRVPSNTLTSPSPPISAGNVLSPRSAHRGGLYSASSGSPAEQEISRWSPSPSPSCSLLSAMLSLNSPLPPLSPRGQKLADAEKHHQAKCLNMIVEKRRKTSDGTEDIIE